MDDEWKDWNVMETVRSTEIPGFMAPTGGAVDLLEGARKRIQNEWKEFVDLLNADGPGTGYGQLLTLRDNMKTRKEKILGEVGKWDDQWDWLNRLKWKYRDKLYRLAGVNDPTEKVDLSSSLPSFADQPIVEAFLDFDDDGQLIEQPELEEGWQAYVENIPIGSKLDELAEEIATDGPDRHRENIIVRYRCSDEELERKGIDLKNLNSPRLAVEMKPSMTWRDALQQIKEKRNSVGDKRRTPKNTARVLDFRLRILENVIYRFETFGSVEALTKQSARDLTDEQLPDIFSSGSKLLEYAEEVQEVYKSDWDPTLGSMKNLKAQLGKKGDSKITQLQTKIRESGLSDHWENGNPESFCSLIVRLVNRHYGI